MTTSTVAAYTIGQSPRPDLLEQLSRRLPSVDFDLIGALDGLDAEEIPPCSRFGYPLETSLADGTRTVVDAHFVAPRLQEAIEARDAGADAHLILCAGPFPRLAAPAPPPGAPRSPKPLVRPFEAAVELLGRLHHRRLDVLVPFAGQAHPAMDKWAGKGFTGRAHVLAEKPRHRSMNEWLAGLLRGSRAQALVFDYVGLSGEVVDEAARALPLPVFDVGRVALDALEKALGVP